MSFAYRFSLFVVVGSEEDEVRAVALDVHRDFCELAIVAEGWVRSAGRIPTRPEALELFAASLDPRDWVALEVTGNAWAIARILESHVARVIVVSPTDTGIRQARAKTDRLDAGTLAKLLRGASSTASGPRMSVSARCAGAWRRQTMVEPVFAHTKFNRRRCDRFLRRGRAACRSEWRLIHATHNLLKLYKHTTAPVTA
jgi:hypothetical protein